MIQPSQTDFLGVKYPVNELFQTVQGEARYTGTPAVFIRLQGCPVGCGWCDTKHTWIVQDATRVPVQTMLEKEKDSPAWALMSIAEILATLDGYRARHVVLTGGEPCIHDLNPITRLIIRSGRTVQIETSGTYPIQCDDSAWVTVSPKIGMGGGRTVRPDAIARANEIKHPVGKQRDIDNLAALLAEGHQSAYADVWLQPLSQSHSATRLCVETATRNGWRISIQTHKYMAIR